MWDRKCPKCKSDNWSVVGSSNCICDNCNYHWIVTAANHLFPERVKNPREDVLMTSGEVAKIFRVDPKTVSRWAKQGRLQSVKTPGGHRRFLRTEVTKLLNTSFQPNSKDSND